MMKKTFLVEGMHCPNCAMVLDGIEDDLPGVKRVATSFHKGLMTVEYDDAIVTEVEILGKIVQLGYTATEIG